MRNDSRHDGWPMRLAATALLLSLAVATASAASLEEIRERGSIRIAVANEVPYGYLDEHGEPRGAGPEVALHLMDELGIESIEWLETSFGDLIPGLREGRFDMAAAEMAILPERCAQILYSEPNTTYGEGLLVRATNPGAINSYADFAQRDDVKVAVMAGADQREILMALDVPDDRIVTIERNEDAIGAITGGEVDAYAATGLTVTALEQIDNDVEVVLDFVDPVIGGEAVRSWGGFAFGPEAEELRDAVNEALVAYKRTSAWERTLTDHGFTQDDVLNSFRFSTEQLCRG